MRKLLVASQKGGVGKTTTAINLAAATAMAGARTLLLDTDPFSSISTALNLAQHPHRQPLRPVSAGLPGVLVCNFLPGLDVLSPYEDGCTDEEIDHLLKLLGTPGLDKCYAALVVNTPPFLGANPGPLLAACDEMLVVMRAEPMAYRTLPAFLELVQRARGKGPGIKVRGIVLTLPEGEHPGGRCERELRGRLGTRILPQVVPYDEEVARSQLEHQIVSHANRQSPGSQCYHELVESFALASEASPGAERADALAALAWAAAELPVVGAKPAPCLVEPPPAPVVAPPAFVLPEAEAPLAGLPEPPVPADEPVLPEPPRPRRRLTPPHPVRIAAALQASRPTPARAPVLRAEEPAKLPPAPPVAPSRATVRSAVQKALREEAAKKHPPHWGLLWVSLAIVVGVSMRFLHVPDWVLPLLVGVGVAAVTVVLLVQFGPQDEVRKSPSGARRRTGGGKRSDSRAEPGGDVSKRLSGLTRRAKAASKNVSEN